MNLASLLNNAHQCQFVNSQLTVAQLTVGSEGSVLAKFKDHVASDARHDSRERKPFPRCLESTRQEVFQAIVAWANAPLEKHIFWLHGRCGTGKTAILQKLCAPNELGIRPIIGGGFFFGRGSPSRGNSQRFPATIAYQLAMNNPIMRALIDEEISNDPGIFETDEEAQFRRLIINPFQRLATIPNAQVPVVVFIVDALDECGTYDDQLAFLDQIRVVLQCVPTLRFLISSREETHLGLKLGDASFSHITERYALDWDRNAAEDIKKVLESGFQDIRRQHASWVGHMDAGSNLKDPWPGMDVIDCLAKAASGQYIYASTVLDFIKKGQPLEKLQVITNPEYISTAPGRNTVAHAFKKLDDLYSQILSNGTLVPSCVGSILALLNVTTFPQRPEVIANLLGLHVADVHATLTAISPLLKVHDLKTPMSEDERIVAIFGHDYFQYEISHTSLRDFLGNPERSGELAHYTVGIKRVALNNFFGLVEEAFTEYKIGPRVSVRDSTWHFFRDSFSSQFQLDEVPVDQVSSYLTNSGLKNLWPNVTLGAGDRAIDVRFRELILATSAAISVLVSMNRSQFAAKNDGSIEKRTWESEFSSWIDFLRSKLFEFYSTVFPNIRTLLNRLPYHIITGSWFTSHYLRNGTQRSAEFAEDFLQTYRPIIEVELQSPRWQSTDRAYCITQSFIDCWEGDLGVVGSAYREHYILVTAWCLKGAIRAVQTRDPSFFTRIFGVVITDFARRDLKILSQEEYQRGHAMRELLDTILTLDLSDDILNDDSDHATAVWQILFWYYLQEEKIFWAERLADHSIEIEADQEFWEKSTGFFEEISEHRSFERCSAILESVKYRYNLWEDNATGILDARLYNKDGCFVDCTNEKNDASWFQGFKKFARRFR